ncbi:MAG: FtsX-like permease family protein [Patescibacteria group bacterium]|nr:FtsX-like permease family protein [Patescibacteria group bacterium]
MGIIYRGFKNAFRNSIRTVSITFILALSIAMALIMFLSLKTVQSKIDEVKSSVGNTITVSPAGIRGFEGGGELLTNTTATTISKIENVSGITKTISARLSADTDTNLESSVEAGSFGRRQMESENQNNSQMNENMPENFSMPINATGTSNLDSTTSLNISELNIISGTKFDESSSKYVALIGKNLAEKNDLAVSSTFTAWDKSIKVVGIFDSGNNFSNAGILMPIKTVQVLSDQENEINSIIVEVSSIDNISNVETAIKEKLGDDVDTVSSQDATEQTTSSLENIKTISLYSLIGAVIAGSVIILLTMIMIVRERRREIGVLKAIGASNLKIVSQFISESTLLTLMGSVLGIILGFAFSNPILKVLINNSTSSTTSGAGQAGGPGGLGGEGGRQMMRMAGEFLGRAGDSLQNLQAVVDYKIILYGLGAAIIIAIIGSIIPSFIISKIRPAEIMRTE